MQFDTLDIAGFRGEAVPNRFLRQENETSRLAIVLPGFGQSADTPYLYYITSHFIDLGADVLLVDYQYNRSAGYQALEAAEQRRWLVTDTTAACRAALAQRPYARVALIGKSLGTRAMAHLLASEQGLRGAEAIWLTPPWREEPVRAALLANGRRNLVVIGTADPHYDADIAAELRHVGDCTLLVISDAEHGLEIDGDVLRSVQALDEAMRAVVGFILW
jgi:hypothetical protein